MDRGQFIANLAKEGFECIVTVERAPNGSINLHAHPFEAKALILEGEIRLRIGEEEQIYKAGDTFHLRPNEPHMESYGPQGVKYVVGRK